MLGVPLQYCRLLIPYIDISENDISLKVGKSLISHIVLLYVLNVLYLLQIPT